MKVGFGVKARSSIINQGPGGANRVIVMPGRIPPDLDAPKSVDAGSITQPRHPSGGNARGGKPRALRWLHSIVTVSIWGVAGDGYEGGLGLGDEAAQYGATIDLLEATVQAMQVAEYKDPTGVVTPVGLADVRFETSSWVRPPTEMGFGQELLVVFTHNGPLFDTPIGVATPQPGITRNPSS